MKKPDCLCHGLNKAVFIIISLLNAAWVIISSYLLITDKECKDGIIYLDNKELYFLTLAILIILYVIIEGCFIGFFFAKVKCGSKNRSIGKG